MIAPLYETVPPSGYGGTERVISALCDELVARGHDVTLFAAAGSESAARLEPVVPAPLRTSMDRQELMEIAPHLHLQMLAEVYRGADDFDLVHSHCDLWTLPFVRTTGTPTVITLHGRLDLDSVQRVFPLYPETPLVSIGDSQRQPLDHFPLRWMGTCYNGLDLDAYFDVAATRGEYLAFVGRLTPAKRPDPYSARVVAKTDYCGFVMSGDPSPPGVHEPVPGASDAVVLWGQGGGALSSRDVEALLATVSPHRVWLLGMFDAFGNMQSDRLVWRGWVDDVATMLVNQPLVVAGAGNRAVADAARSGSPLIVVPQARPFDEQAHHAESLDAAGAAAVVIADSSLSAWPAAVATARRRRPTLSRLAQQNGAAESARTICDAFSNTCP